MLSKNFEVRHGSIGPYSAKFSGSIRVGTVNSVETLAAHFDPSGNRSILRVVEAGLPELRRQSAPSLIQKAPGAFPRRL